MLRGTNPDYKEEIRRRIDIASLIGEYVVLRKAGRNLLGLCPFHREKTPSFTVSPDKQMFYCYGCSEGGDAFSFLMKLNHLTFPEAVRELAKRAGVVIPAKAMSREEKERQTLREQIRLANELAAGFFAGLLQGPAGRDAREYLQNRGIGEEAIQAFRLGVAPDEWRRLSDFLARKGVPPVLAEQAGLLVAREGQGQGHYDRFRGRLMIPIEDVDGRVIAFGGRVMGTGEPKYLNSPESPIYTKGNNLYGLARTREAIREKGFAVLVEGYFDLISLWNAGIRNVVAPLGTALTRAQVDLLRRYTGQVAAVFDPDEAGRKALSRSLELFLAGGLHARAVILPDGSDPDAFVRSQGREAMETLILRASPMVDYYIEEILGGRESLEQDRDKLREAVAFIARLEDAVERNLFIKKVAESFDIDQEVLKKEVQRLLARPPGTAAAKPPGPTRPAPAGEYDPLEMSLIQMMVEFPTRMAAVAESGVLGCFASGELRLFGEAMLARAAAQLQTGPDVASVIGDLSEGPLREKLLARLVGESPFEGAMLDRLLADTIGQIRRKWFRRKDRMLRQQIAKAEAAGDRDLGERLLREYDALLREKDALLGKKGLAKDPQG